MKKILKVSILLAMISVTGCIKRDSLEGITIYTTAYPIEYITNYLYGDNSTISSIYPNGVDIETYELNDKLINDYSSGDLFIYNSYSKEKDYVIPFFNNNKNLKIIDSSSTIDVDNVKELWVNPTNFLKLTRNIKEGLDEYINNQYVKNEIEEAYQDLRVKVSALDVELRHISKDAIDKNIIIGSPAFNFLTKYDFNVVDISGDEMSDKLFTDAKKLIEAKTSEYIFVDDLANISNNVKSFIDNYNIQLVSLHSLENLTDGERNAGFDYLYYMNENIEKIKLETLN